VTRGVSGTRAITEFDASGLSCRVSASVPDAALLAASNGHHHNGNGAGENDRADPRRYAKVSRIAVLAAREALDDAGLDNSDPNLGVIVGSGAGGIDVAERGYSDYFAGALHRISPYAIPVSIVGIVSSEISIALGLRGISHVLSTGCTSSTDAIGYAARLIRAGEADVLLTGGADACATPAMIFGFGRMRVTSTRYNDRPGEASRPFDHGRDGFVLGEGAWVLAVENEEHARARGARIYATVDGYGSTCDAYHRVQMDPHGTEIVRAMELALQRSGRAPEEVGYINYHGTSTVLNDAIEARASGGCWGRRPIAPPDRLRKSMIGHPQGRAAPRASSPPRWRCHATCCRRRRLTDQDPACDMDFAGTSPGPRKSARRALQLPGVWIEEQRPHTRRALMLDVLIAGAGPAGRSRLSCSRARRRVRWSIAESFRATSCAVTRSTRRDARPRLARAGCRPAERRAAALRDDAERTQGHRPR
jgi:3-oxoacyl-[acyl-carrier-protein] synthase II